MQFRLHNGIEVEDKCFCKCIFKSTKEMFSCSHLISNQKNFISRRKLNFLKFECNALKLDFPCPLIFFCILFHDATFVKHILFVSYYSFIHLFIQISYLIIITESMRNYFSTISICICLIENKISGFDFMNSMKLFVDYHNKIYFNVY